MIRLALSVAWMVVFIGGCAGASPARIDGSSAERFDESLEGMTSELGESEQMQLGAAILRIMFREIDSPDEQSALLEAAKVPASEFRGMLDGMTFEQIVEFSERYRKPWESTADDT